MRVAAMRERTSELVQPVEPRINSLEAHVHHAIRSADAARPAPGESGRSLMLDPFATVHAHAERTNAAAKAWRRAARAGGEAAQSPSVAKRDGHDLGRGVSRIHVGRRGADVRVGRAEYRPAPPRCRAVQDDDAGGAQRGWEAAFARRECLGQDLAYEPARSCVSTFCCVLCGGKRHVLKTQCLVVAFARVDPFPDDLYQFSPSSPHRNERRGGSAVQTLPLQGPSASCESRRPRGWCEAQGSCKPRVHGP